MSALGTVEPDMHPAVKEALAPLPVEFRWIPWGYLLDDEPTTEAEELQVEHAAWLAAISERTHYVPVVELAEVAR